MCGLCITTIMYSLIMDGIDNSDSDLENYLVALIHFQDFCLIDRELFIFSKSKEQRKFIDLIILTKYIECLLENNESGIDNINKLLQEAHCQSIFQLISSYNEINLTHDILKISPTLWSTIYNKSLFVSEYERNKFLNDSHVHVETAKSMLTSYYNWWVMPQRKCEQGDEFSDGSCEVVSSEEYKTLMDAFPLLYFCLVLLNKCKTGYSIIEKIGYNHPSGGICDGHALDLWLRRKSIEICLGRTKNKHATNLCAKPKQDEFFEYTAEYYEWKKVNIPNKI